MTDTVAPLTGSPVRVDGDSPLAAETCLRHLSLLGAGADADPGAARVGIPWWPDAAAANAPAAPPGTPGGERVVQALSGLMAVHGRHRGRPEPVGLEICSVAAGVLAAQGLLAAEIGRRRGLAIRRVETSVLDGALAFLRHHLAVAMCDEALPARLFESGCGPPFATADGATVEIEVLRSDAWGRFWQALGADPEAVRRGWQPYLFKHTTAACPLPPELRDAVARHPLTALLAAAGSSGASVRRLRTYPEVLADPGWGWTAPWTFTPGDEPAPPRPAGAALPRPAGGGDLPLSGLRVVEATTRVQGPLAGLLLQSLGAEVCRVELPGGDPGRGFPPFVAGRGAVFHAYNAGKRPIEVDYHAPGGRRLLGDRIAAADVFLHNWRPGRAEELGLAYADLATRAPGLVVCQAAGWAAGDDDGVATDYLVQADCGLADGLTPEGEAPRPTRLTLVDVAGGLVACEGILAALLARERTGRGARVDTSLASAAHAFQVHVLERIGTGREVGRRSGRPLPGPFDRPLGTKAGALAVAVEGEAGQRRLADACGVAAGEPAAAVAAALRARPAAEWEGLLRDAGICAAAVRTDLSALPRDPVAGAALQPDDGGCWLPAAPWRFLP
jgi:CoA:oxalate CoA-transferase